MACATPNTNRSRGFTLVETLIAAAILAATVVAVLSPVFASYKQAQAMEETTIASSLARQLLDEITAKPFLDPQDGVVSNGPADDEKSRAAFDDIGDYDGYSDTTAALTESSGAAVNWKNPAVYTRKATVKFRTAPNGADGTSGDFAMVTVTVSSSDGHTVTAQRLVSNYPRLLLKPTP